MMIQQTSEAREDLLGRVANEFFEAAARGERPSIEAYADRFPEIAEDVRRVFPALALVGDSTAGSAANLPRLETSECKQLGDFRIVR
jgi:eukaryotic-like serine/threonine-protein kinase